VVKPKIENFSDGNFGYEISFRSFADLKQSMETKDRILLKSDALFMQYGVRSVSMDDIANNLGMSKKTLYQYYADKDELVAAVVDGHINDVERDCLKCNQNAEDAIHEIFLTLEHITGEFSNMNPMLLHDLEKFHFKAFQRFKEYKEKFLAEIIRKNIIWGIEEELYRPDINVDLITRFRLATMMLPFDVSVFPPGKFKFPQTTEATIEHFVYGLATIKGHKLITKYNQQRQKNLNHEENKK
jgi:TetR/AcrR family transcriptional regulator, cholesterol catabolism regulator